MGTGARRWYGEVERGVAKGDCGTEVGEGMDGGLVRDCGWCGEWMEG